MNLNAFRTRFSSDYYSLHILPHSGWRFCFVLLLFFSFGANCFFFSFQRNSLMFYFESIIMQPKAQFCRCLIYVKHWWLFRIFADESCKIHSMNSLRFFYELNGILTANIPQQKHSIGDIFFEIHFLLIKNRLKKLVFSSLQFLAVSFEKIKHKWHNDIVVNAERTRNCSN